MWIHSRALAHTRHTLHPVSHTFIIFADPIKNQEAVFSFPITVLKYPNDNNFILTHSSKVIKAEKEEWKIPTPAMVVGIWGHLFTSY